MDLGLVDPAAPKNENLGFIRLFIKISLASAAEVAAASREKQKSPGSKLWTSVLTVTLLEGNNLPAMDQNGECVCPSVDCFASRVVWDRGVAQCGLLASRVVWDRGVDCFAFRVVWDGGGGGGGGGGGVAVWTACIQSGLGCLR